MMLKTREVEGMCGDSSCSLCENPYPYNCEHCVGVLQSEDMPMEVKEQPKMFIGSGEDVWL